VVVGLYSSTWDGACLRASDQNFSVFCEIHYFNFYLLVYFTAIGLISVFVCEYFVRGCKKNVTQTDYHRLQLHHRRHPSRSMGRSV